jgi:hypothetical protein
MARAYRPYFPDEEFLLPAMDKGYGNEKRGQPPYNPRMTAKLLVYAWNRTPAGGRHCVSGSGGG